MAAGASLLPNTCGLPLTAKRSGGLPACSPYRGLGSMLEASWTGLGRSACCCAAVSFQTGVKAIVEADGDSHQLMLPLGLAVTVLS